MQDTPRERVDAAKSMTTVQTPGGVCGGQLLEEGCLTQTPYSMSLRPAPLLLCALLQSKYFNLPHYCWHYWWCFSFAAMLRGCLYLNSSILMTAVLLDCVVFEFCTTLSSRAYYVEQSMLVANTPPVCHRPASIILM